MTHAVGPKLLETLAQRFDAAAEAGERNDLGLSGALIVKTWREAARMTRAALAAPASAPTVDAAELDPDERFVRLATAVLGLRDFLALHRKATGRSDVNIRKVLTLLDAALRASAPGDEG